VFLASYTCPFGVRSGGDNGGFYLYKSGEDTYTGYQVNFSSGF
jgi:hypothetical protein